MLALVLAIASACSDDSDADTAADTSTAESVDQSDDSSASSEPAPVELNEPTVSGDIESALRGDRTHESFPDALIPLDRIRSGGPPPDGIPPIDAPTFITIDEVDWLQPDEPVISLVIEGDVRAYPIQILMWHEIVNDEVGGAPVTVAYCPLCNSALAYDRRLGDLVLDFGTSGELYNSSLVMYDRQTESLWTHFDAKAVVGHLTGHRLTTYSIQTVSWDQFTTAHPDGLVLSRDTGFGRSYGRNPYVGYDTPDERPFLFDGDQDDRLAWKERVIVVRDADEPAVVLRLTETFESGAIAFEAHGRELVAVVQPGTSSPLSAATTFGAYDQGSANVFVASLDGAAVDLSRTDDGTFSDSVSGIEFDVFGRALDGSDARLESVEHLDTFWFAIAAFEPDSRIIEIGN